MKHGFLRYGSYRAVLMFAFHGFGRWKTIIQVDSSIRYLGSFDSGIEISAVASRQAICRSKIGPRGSRMTVPCGRELKLESGLVFEAIDVCANDVQ